MLLDTIHGLIDRRILLNYRIAPDVLANVLPAGFRPKLFKGYGVGGICMIRFKQLRPRFTPAWLGLNSENAAHRIAVEWEQDGALREGVFIPRRDTNSSFNKKLGGRVFPGIFQRSRFDSNETQSSVKVQITRPDGAIELSFAGRPADQIPASSIFSTLDEAAGFFSLGATGYSSTLKEGHYHGMELHSLNWKIAPLGIDEAKSGFFDDVKNFPQGSATLDCALIMTGIEHEWRSRPDLYLNGRGSFSTQRQ